MSTNTEIHAPRIDDATAVDNGAAASWLQIHLWWLLGVVGLGLFGLLSATNPSGRHEAAAWVFALRLVAFGFVAATVAFFPWPRPKLYWLVFVAFFAFTAYLVPRISYFYYMDGVHAQSDNFYTHLYVLAYPAIVLTTTAAYRLGGGSPGRCLKIAGTGMTLIFSGFLDLMWYFINPVDLPAKIDAPHINAFTGGPIPYSMAIVFACAHIPIIVLLNLLPLDRWFAQWGLVQHVAAGAVRDDAR